MSSTDAAGAAPWKCRQRRTKPPTARVSTSKPPALAKQSDEQRTEKIKEFMKNISGRSEREDVQLQALALSSEVYVQRNLQKNQTKTKPS